MKILLITQEAPLLKEEVVSGNAVRTVQIRSALEAAGHEVVQTWLAAVGSQRSSASGLTFRNHDELQGILLREEPGAVIVGYWELLAMLPCDLQLPVVLDYVAPRTLEELYESPETVSASLRRLRNELRKCDLLLVGNELQRHLLINTLLETGFDLRRSDPVRVVPLGAELAEAPESDPEADGWLLVSGGVSWPWRSSGTFHTELESFATKHESAVRLVHFGGDYRWHENDSQPSDPAARTSEGPVSYRALEPYRKFSRFLTSSAHIGVELAEKNVEREYSQSFRSLEFLRHGLPLLCNRYLPVANLVERYGAGWIVDEPGSIHAILARITANPDEWREKSANARKLVSEALQPARSVEPLVRWLENPVKAARLQPAIISRETAPVLGVPPLAKRLKRQLGLVRTVLLNRLFGQQRGNGIVVVTRGDLFPPDHGAAVRTIESAKALSRDGTPVGIVTDDRKSWFAVEQGEIRPRELPFWTRLFSLPGALAKLLHFSKDLPYSNSFLYLPLTDGSFFWRTLAVARELNAGILQAEFPAYALPCIEARDTLDCSVVLVQHNVEYERIKAQVNELSTNQYNNLRDIEIDLCNRSDAVVCVSDNDRQKLAEDGVHPDLLHTVPHGVNLAQFDQAVPADARARFAVPDGCPLLVYHGTFSYPPNQEALRIFAEILLPGLDAVGLECHLLAIGRDAPAVSPHPRIHLTGSVEQVAPWLKSADLAVVPLVEGGGTRMKIIDCFAACLPVVSTSKGIEGIPVVPGRHALVLDDWKEFIGAIADLCRNPQKAADLAQQGRALADSLDWRTAAEKYRNIYARLG